MKRLSVAVFALSLLVGSAMWRQASASPKTPSDAQALKAAETRMMEAAMNHDAKAFEAVCDTEYRTVNVDGSAFDLRETLAEMNGPNPLPKIDLTDASESLTRIIGNSALITGRWKFRTSDNQVLDLRYVEVWVKRGNEWKFVHWHATPVSAMGIQREKANKTVAAK